MCDVTHVTRRISSNDGFGPSPSAEAAVAPTRRRDDGGMSTEPGQPLEPGRPVELAAALATFEQLWSPRIVTRVNDYDVRIAKVAGDHVWHAHDDTDEFFLVLDGELHIALRDAAASVPDGSARASGDATAAAASTAAASAERAVVLPKGAVFVVPRGVEHRPSAPAGAHILMFEPTGTSTVGDRHDPIPGHVDATTGHSLT